MLEFARTRFCLDEKRVYATGKSQGGGFVGQLACDAALSPRFAAFAPVAGAYYITSIENEEDCYPNKVQIPCAAPVRRGGIPIMAFHGGDDRTINYGGGWRADTCLPSIPHWAAFWAVREGLHAKPVNTTAIPGSANGEVMDYGDGLVNLVYAGDDVKHVWPDHDNAAFEASSMVMDFFRQHTL